MIWLRYIVFPMIWRRYSFPNDLASLYSFPNDLAPLLSLWGSCVANVQKSMFVRPLRPRIPVVSPKPKSTRDMICIIIWIARFWDRLFFHGWVETCHVFKKFLKILYEGSNLRTVMRGGSTKVFLAPFFAQCSRSAKNQVCYRWDVAIGVKKNIVKKSFWDRS